MRSSIQLLLIVCGFWSNCISLSAQSDARSVDGRPTVLVFLSLDCPISQKYIGELNRIDSLYHERILLQGVVPGKVDKATLAQFNSEYGVRFSIRTDVDYATVKKYSAHTTPEAFLLDATGKVMYKGAIDNWFFDLGSNRQQVTEYYLTQAIDSVLKKKKPAIHETEAVGCLIFVPKKYKG